VISGLLGSITAAAAEGDLPFVHQASGDGTAARTACMPLQNSPIGVKWIGPILSFQPDADFDHC
jgi:hypothetical protein